MDLRSFLGRINEFILNPLILLMFVVALLVFFWGLVEFIYKAGSEDAREVGKQHMMYGIIGMVIMVGAYGFAAIILKTFGITAPPNAYIPALYR